MWVMMTSHSNSKQNNPKTFCLRVIVIFYVFNVFLNTNEIIRKRHERRTRSNGCCRSEGKCYCCRRGG